jgi:signal transduction histidine kinase
VQLYFGRSALELTITNPALASDPGSPGRGHGLTGMGERASLLGGTLTAESRDGAFRVQAELPYGDRRR